MSSSSSSLEDDSDFTSLSSSLTFSELAFCDRFQVGQDELPLESKWIKNVKYDVYHANCSNFLFTDRLAEWQEMHVVG